jgi:hypothetical protein
MLNEDEVHYKMNNPSTKLRLEPRAVPLVQSGAATSPLD